MNWFITGTDTGVGKTFFTALLTRAARKAGLDTVALKPICCGDRADAEELRNAAGGELSLNDVNPVWLRPPLAPYAAAMVENRTVDLDLIRRTFQRVRTQRRSVLVEGVGGWLAPIAHDYAVRELACDLGLAVVIVILNRLGAINHALLTVESVRAAGLKCAGMVINDHAKDDAGMTNPGVLEELTGLPVLFRIGRNQTELELGVA